MWLFLLILGAGFWAGIFAISLKVLVYFKGILLLGDVLVYKLLSMLLMTLFSLLVFSSIVTALSKLYLSRDLPLVHSLPLPTHRIYLARWLESMADSSWMVIVYTLPVFISYGMVFHTGLLYYFVMSAVILLFSLLASALSTILVMLAVILVPANRIRSIFVFLGLCLFLVLFVAFRMLRPARDRTDLSR